MGGGLAFLWHLTSNAMALYGILQAVVSTQQINWLYNQKYAFIILTDDL